MGRVKAIADGGDSVVLVNTYNSYCPVSTLWIKSWSKGLLQHLQTP